MAKRRRKRHEGPLNPYAHRPQKPGIYVLYIDWRDMNKAGVSIYAEAFGAKRHLDILLQGLDFTVATDDDLVGLIDDKRYLTAENGIRVRCSLLQDVLDHVDSPEEEAWEMESRHLREIEAFRYGKAITEEDKPPEDDVRSLNAKTRRTKRRKAKAAAKPRKSKETPAGTVTVAMIAESLNILPREARARLRRANVPKPDLGWIWDADSVDQIKELIAKG